MTVQYYRRRKKVNGAYIDIVPDIARYAEGLADSTRAVMLANIVLKEEIDSSLLLSENRTIGSISQPVYLDKGIITACTDIPSKSGANTFQNTNTFAGSLIVGSYNVGDKIKHFDDDIDYIYADMSNMVKKVGGGTQTIDGSLIVGGNDLTKAVTTNTAQTITGEKTFSSILATNTKLHNKLNVGTKGKWWKVCSFGNQGSRNHIFEIVSAAGVCPAFGILHTENDYAGFPRIYWAVRRWNSPNGDLRKVNCVALVTNVEVNKIQLWIYGNRQLSVRVMDAYDGRINFDDVEMDTVAQEVDDLDSLGGDVYYATDYPYGKFYSESPEVEDSPYVVVNKEYVEATDGVTNNLMHRTANEEFSGIKTYSDYLRKKMSVSVDPAVAHETDSQNVVQIVANDADRTLLGYLYVKVLSDNLVQWIIGVRNRDGTRKEIPLITSD